MNRPRIASALDRVVDPALAFGLFVEGGYEIWVETGQVSGSRIANTAFLLVISVALVWRRRRPVVTLAIVSVGSIAWSYALYLEHQPPLAMFLALVLAVFAAGARVSGRDVVIAVALFAAFGVADFVAVLAGPRAAADSGAIWIFLPLTWGLGRVVYRQRVLAASLAARASQLEHEREEKARLAVALERARIARELHDVVSHNVSVMVVQASVERRALKTESEATREVLGSIEEIGRATLVELRRLLGVLRKRDEAAPLAPPPTLARLDELVAQAAEAGVPVDLRFEGERVPLAAGLELSAYRIVQEALTNVLKHAAPTCATVVVRYDAEALALEIADDGRGLGDGAHGGHGLVGMRERAALHGGTLEIAGGDGAGFIVRAWLPLAGS